MSNAGTPPGWYPDPENPGQSRYWDGAAWAAPVAATPGAAAPGGSGAGGNKTPLIVVAIIAVLALIGGGAFFLLSGDDSEDDEERVATSGEDDDEDEDEDDDGPGGDRPSSSGVEELSEDDFAEFADGVCTGLEDDLDATAELYFGGIPDDELADLPSSVLSAFESDMREATEEAFTELRTVAPEGEVDDWLELVDDWEGLYDELIDLLSDADFERSQQLSSEVAEITERTEDFGLTCLGGGSMTSPSDPSPGSGGSSQVGEPTEPPPFDEPSLEALGQDCYEGDLGACDDLYFESPFGSPEEEYGDTCGGRTDGGSLCAFLED